MHSKSDGLYSFFLQLDPHVAKAPIILGKQKPDDDSVVKWIRDEFTELDQVFSFVEIMNPSVIHNATRGRREEQIQCV